MGLRKELAMMKLIETLLARFQRKADGEPDAFEKRLQSMTAPRRPSLHHHQSAPHLFRREPSHA